MTEHDDFDAQLRASLERQADGASHADLAAGALRQARRIRKRRRIGTAAAALAVVAVVVPVGVAVVGDQAPRDSTATQPNTSQPPTSTVIGPPPEPIEVTLADLARGDDPSVPYIDGGTFHAADGSNTELSLEDGPYSATKLPGGEVVGWYRPNGNVANYATDDGFVLPPGEGVAGGPVVDSDGSIAWVEQEVDQFGNPVGLATLKYGASLDDVRTVSLGDVTVTNLLAVRDGVAVANLLENSKPVVVRVDMLATEPQVERPWPAVSFATAVSPGLDLLAVGTEKTTQPNDSPCAALVSAADLGELWNSCAWMPMGFSADGSQVVAVRVGSEGFGPTRVAVLDTATGSVLQALTTPGTFGEQSFEANGVVDMVTVDDGNAAIVRCTVAAECVLATDVQRAEPDSLSAPYQLTP